MNLQDVLALRPDRGSDGSTIRAAIARAEKLRDDQLVRCRQLAEERAGSLLIADDKALLKGDQEAAAAKLTADRLDALLPAMREDLAGAEGRDALTALRADAAEVSGSITALQAWLKDELPQIWASIARGFELEDEAVARNTQFLAAVRAAYERPEVRQAGALGIETPDLPAERPRATFMKWAGQR